MLNLQHFRVPLADVFYLDTQAGATDYPDGQEIFCSGSALKPNIGKG